MSDDDESIPSDRPFKAVECPECGEAFPPRGIAPHRRMRHGIPPEVALDLAGTLSRIASVLERLDARMAEGAARVPPGPPAPAQLPVSKPVTPRSKLLEEGLRQVLAEIARVKQDTERQIAALGSRSASDEQRLLEETAFHALGSLRRRQAELIYRLHKDGRENGNGIDALTVL